MSGAKLDTELGTEEGPGAAGGRLVVTWFLTVRPFRLKREALAVNAAQNEVSGRPWIADESPIESRRLIPAAEGESLRA